MGWVTIVMAGFFTPILDLVDLVVLVLNFPFDLAFGPYESHASHDGSKIFSQTEGSQHRLWGLGAVTALMGLIGFAYALNAYAMKHWSGYREYVLKSRAKQIYYKREDAKEYREVMQAEDVVRIAMEKADEIRRKCDQDAIEQIYLDLEKNYK